MEAFVYAFLEIFSGYLISLPIVFLIFLYTRIDYILTVGKAEKVYEGLKEESERLKKEYEELNNP